MIISYAQNNIDMITLLEFNWDDHVVIFAGPIAAILLSCTIVISLEPIRRTLWTCFILFHSFFATSALVMISIHVKFYDMWLLIVPFLLYCGDLYIRFMHGMIYPSSLIYIKHHQKIGITELHIRKPWMMYKPGQYVFVYIPFISPIDCHPFSIANARHEIVAQENVEASPSVTHNIVNNTGVIKLFVKNMNGGTLNWTNRLAVLAEKIENNTQQLENTIVRIQGPFGNLTIEPLEYDYVVLIAAGIGITPIMSILLDTYYERKSNSACRVQKIFFSWSVKHSDYLHLFQDKLFQLDAELVHQSLSVTQSEDRGQSLILSYGEGRMSHVNYLRLVKSMIREKQSSEIIKVAVFTCGPECCVASVQTAVAHEAELDIKFHLHKEVFSL